MLGAYVAYSGDRALGTRAHRLLQRGRRWRRSRSALVGVADRGAAAAPHLSRAGTVPARRHLRRRPGRQGRRRVPSGARRTVGPRAPGLAGRSRSASASRSSTWCSSPSAPLVLGAMWLLLTQHALGHAGARRDAGPRDGGRARRQSGQLFTSVFFVGAVLAGLGGSLQMPRESVNLDLDLTVIAAPSSSSSWAAWAASPAPFSPRFCSAAPRPSHRHRHCLVRRGHRLLQAHPGARVPGHGGRARGPALGSAGQAGGRAAAWRPCRRRRCDRAVLDASRWSGSRCCWPCRCWPTATSPCLLDRHPLLRAVRRQPAFHHRARRHDVFGHAAYFGLGAYGAALLLKHAGLPMEAALAAGAARRRRLARGLSAGSACGSRASISPC